MPDTENGWREIARKFDVACYFPYCVGCIDGKHIFMQNPANAGSTCTLITRELSVSFYWPFAMQITALRSLMLGARVESQMTVYFGDNFLQKDGKKNTESTQS
jgi:hypothetical protein